MNSNFKTNHTGGFTILEVLIVMGILSIGILGVMTLQITATNSNSNARRITDGTNFLSNEFESLMLLDYDDALLTVGANPTSDQGRYTIEHTVAAGPIPNTKQVDIIVTLDAGTNRDITVTYYRADTF